MEDQANRVSVLHVATAMSWRGGEQQVAYLVMSLREKGIRQFILCSSGSEMEKFCIREDIPCFTSVKSGGFSLAYSRMIRNICRRESVRLVHAHDSHAHSFAIYAAVLFGNKARIIVSRRVDFPVRKGFLSSFKYNHASIARIICVSDKIRSVTAPALSDPGKLVTIHSGIDLSRFRDKKNTGILRRDYGFSPGMKIIANISALAPHKDYLTFTDTVAILVQKRKDCIFLMIGDGPDREKIKNYITSKGLDAHILMTGFRSDIAGILPELDVMLITSETEGLGTSILDAFACRVPVVATRAGGIPELIIDEKTGLLAPVKDPARLAAQVERLVTDKQLGKSLAEGAWQHLQQFTRQATAEKTLTVYRHVLQTDLQDIPNQYRN